MVLQSPGMIHAFFFSWSSVCHLKATWTSSTKQWAHSVSQSRITSIGSNSWWPGNSYIQSEISILDIKQLMCYVSSGVTLHLPMDHSLTLFILRWMMMGRCMPLELSTLRQQSSSTPGLMDMKHNCARWLLPTSIFSSTFFSSCIKRWSRKGLQERSVIVEVVPNVEGPKWTQRVDP